MSWRRALGIGLTLSSAILTAAAAQAAPVTFHATYVQEGAGTVTVARTADPVTGDVSYTVVIKGRIGVHGWSYTGRLSGQSGPQGDTGSIPGFTVTSNPAGVSGSCAAYGNLGTSVSPVDSADFVFSCLLAKAGSTPWLSQLNSSLAPTSVDTGKTVWSGAYVDVDPEATAIGANRQVTYGDSQVQEFSSHGALQYTMQFSGQAAIGPSVYRGELLSALSAPVYLHDGSDIPPVDVAGSNAGHHVTGQCAGLPGGAESDVFSGGWTFECQLSLDSATPAAVTLQTAPMTEGVICTGTGDDETCDSIWTGLYDAQ